MFIGRAIVSVTTIKNLYHSLNGLGVNYLRNFLLDAITNDPTVAEALQLKLNTTDNRLKFHDGTQVKTLAYLSDLDSYVRYRGGHNASLGVPTPASSLVLPGDSIQAGDKWLVTTAGTITGIGGESDNLSPGDFVTAIVDDAVNPEDFVAINANIDTSDVVIGEEITLLSLSADTPTTIESTKLGSVDIVSIRDDNNQDITSSILIKYLAEDIEITSSVALSTINIKMIGSASTENSTIPDDVDTGGGSGDPLI